MKVRAVFLLAAFYLVVPLLQAWDYGSAQPFADAIDNLNYVASILAYNWLLLNVVLGLKLPALQNTVPYDLRIRVHLWTTLGLTVFLAWHAVYYLFLKVKFIDLVTWTLMGTFMGLLFLSALWIPLPGLKRVRERTLAVVRHGLLRSYDGLKTIHKGLYLALAGLTYLHILGAKVIGVASPWSTFAFQALFVAVAVLWIWTRVRNRILPSLEVTSVAAQGGIVRLGLAPHPRLSYQPGQFAFLRFEHPELRGEEHPFSFTSATHEDEVGFAVRELGDFTSRLTRLRPGDRVKVNGGFGAFRPPRGTEPLALIGSGIGAAPLVSILKDLNQRQNDREVLCLLAVTRRSELLDPAGLESLRQTMPDLALKIFVSEEGSPLYGEQMFAREIPDPKRYRYYLCSSDRVRQVVVASLSALGVKRRKVHYEAFQLG